jgi:hypothetical protein
MNLCIDCKHYHLSIHMREMDRCSATFISPVDGKPHGDGRPCLEIRRDTAACGPEGKWFESEEPSKLEKRKQDNDRNLRLLRSMPDT